MGTPKHAGSGCSRKQRLFQNAERLCLGQPRQLDPGRVFKRIRSAASFPGLYPGISSFVVPATGEVLFHARVPFGECDSDRYERYLGRACAKSAHGTNSRMSSGSDGCN